ncbi:MAG: hypothetical protein HYX41_00515 [Bdellovibrio sp.]|nr:hypothetical protein [Bdellovibrio sp.]
MNFRKLSVVLGLGMISSITPASADDTCAAALRKLIFKEASLGLACAHGGVTLIGAVKCAGLIPYRLQSVNDLTAVSILQNPEQTKSASKKAWAARQFRRFYDDLIKKNPEATISQDELLESVDHLNREGVSLGVCNSAIWGDSFIGTKSELSLREFLVSEDIVRKPQLYLELVERKRKVVALHEEEAQKKDQAGAEQLARNADAAVIRDEKNRVPVGSDSMARASSDLSSGRYKRLTSRDNDEVEYFPKSPLTEDDIY